MCACDEKHNAIENERKRQNLDMRYPSSIKREKHQRPVNETTEQNRAPLRTTLYNLPLEILDIILQKSYLQWMLYSAIEQRDEEVIKSLTSVDFCFYQRITRRRFKKAVLRYLKDFYGKTRKRYAILRNNRNYLRENIKLSKELISSLLSLNCITLKESHLIQRQHSGRDKIDRLLTIMRSFNEEKFSNCVKCLRKINQKTVARIIKNGGGVIKIQVHICGEKHTESTATLQQLHQNIEELEKSTIAWSRRMNRFQSQLSDEGIKILNSQLDSQTVVVWIWCRSQAALEYLQRLYESHQEIAEFFEAIQPFTPKIIDININQFKKNIVVCAISINLTRRMEISRNEEDRVLGVTKLRNEIYVLYDDPQVIRVFEDGNAFRVRKVIEVKEFNYPFDIGSSGKDNSVYVSARHGKCVWKIARETDDEYNITKWLTIDYLPLTLSVSSDGQLLVVDDSSSILRIYGSDAELIRSIHLSKDIENPWHAVKTSFGSFIISHSRRTVKRNEEKLCSRSSDRDKIMDKKAEIDEEGNEMEENKKVHEIYDEKNEGVEGTDKIGKKEFKEEESESSWSWVHVPVVSELTSDGLIVVRRFILSNVIQEFTVPPYLSLDSDDQVLLFGYGYSFGKVILLDSDLKWNRTLLPAEVEDGEMDLPHSHSLCYDDENKQLIVAETFAVNVFSVIRI